MTVTPKPMPPLAWFTPRLIDGPENAPWVVFLDPNPEIPKNLIERVHQTFDRYREAVFAINRCAISESYRRQGKDWPPFELPEYGAPDVVRCLGCPTHPVLALTLPPAWLTGQVRSYALSSHRPTVTYGILAHRWLTDLGPSESNRLLWPGYAS